MAGQNACPVKCEAYLTGVCVSLRGSVANKNVFAGLRGSAANKEAFRKLG
jgi:hypothetical protein